MPYMTFAIFGGDDRSVRLCRLLRADGHTVRPFALELAAPDCAPDAAAAALGADCVILPLPCEREGRCNTPLSAAVHTPGALLAGVAAGTLVCAGMAGEDTRAACRAGRLPLADYGRREEFALRNAELTAEGALPLLLSGPKALGDSRVLVAGYGRIGRALAAKLRALGASVTVAARSVPARTAAALAGCAAVTPETAAGDFDAVVNTVPAGIFGRRALERFGDAALLELASPPYGFDLAAAAALGKPVTVAGGLPGKTAPESAARAVLETIYAILEESK